MNTGAQMCVTQRVMNSIVLATRTSVGDAPDMAAR
jgi:hypothetical protein